MTDQQHPITPPPELVEQWRDLPEFTDGRRQMIMVTLSKEKLLDIAAHAARWGADQELEACCEWVTPELAVYLRTNRRPKPPSLKEQALERLSNLESDEPGYDLGIIRRALEQLDD